MSYFFQETKNAGMVGPGSGPMMQDPINALQTLARQGMLH